MPNSSPEFSSPQPAVTDQPATAILLQDQSLAHVGGIVPTPLIGPAPLPVYDHTPPAPANDDLPTPSGPTRKRRSRRKRKREDRRRSRRSFAIKPADYKAARHAYIETRRMGRPLDTLVTLRPEAFELMTEPERHAWTRQRLRTLGDFFSTPAVNDNAPRPPFTAIWARESKRVGEGREAYGEAEHVHVLCRCGSADLRAKLEKMLKKHLMGRNEVDVRPATQTVTHFENGWWCDAGTYILKAVAPAGWRFNPTIPHRQSGPIHGARTGMTANLRALVPKTTTGDSQGFSNDLPSAA